MVGFISVLVLWPEVMGNALLINCRSFTIFARYISLPWTIVPNKKRATSNCPAILNFHFSQLGFCKRQI